MLWERGKAAASREQWLMAVSQCVCHRVSFAELKALADQTGMGLVELHQTTQCGSRCGLCIPYIRYMMQTGDTDPPIMWSPAFREMGIKCTSIERLENRLIAQGKLDPSQIAASEEADRQKAS